MDSYIAQLEFPELVRGGASPEVVSKVEWKGKREWDRERSFVHCLLWPRGSAYEGTELTYIAKSWPQAIVVIDLPPGDLELLIAEYWRTPGDYEQAAARTLQRALNEWNARTSDDDDEWLARFRRGGSK